uniref:40S ribosomal protein S19 n=1 Tax=Bicosoecida sp. CB-2014 TaxID=1486930 RepID=A0A7S1G9Z5_9STRA
MADEFEGTRGATLRDVGAAEFIATFAAFLKKQGKLELPKWVDLVKTGTGREMCPIDPDWFYTRTAAVARKVYLRPGVGLGALKRVFGGAKRLGVNRNKFKDGSGAVIRTALIQLNALGLVEVSEDGRGRRVTRKGQQALDRIAGQIINAE